MKRTTWQRCNKYCSRGSSEGTCSDDRAEQRMRMCRDGRGLGSKLVSFAKGRKGSVALQLCPPLQFGPLTYQPIECAFISSNQSAL